MQTRRDVYLVLRFVALHCHNKNFDETNTNGKAIKAAAILACRRVLANAVAKACRLEDSVFDEGGDDSFPSAEAIRVGPEQLLSWFR